MIYYDFVALTFWFHIIVQPLSSLNIGLAKILCVCFSIRYYRKINEWTFWPTQYIGFYSVWENIINYNEEFIWMSSSHCFSHFYLSYTCYPLNNHVACNYLTSIAYFNTSLRCYFISKHSTWAWYFIFSFLFFLFLEEGFKCHLASILS